MKKLSAIININNLTKEGNCDKMICIVNKPGGYSQCIDIKDLQ